MKKAELQQFLISKTQNIMEALSRINKNSRGVVFVVEDDCRLIGSITDGDIRRGLLAGKSVQSPVVEVMTVNPLFLTNDLDDKSIRSFFRTSGIRQLPVLDNLRRILDVLFSEDLSLSPKISAVIMAGGLGKRLYPITKDLPKPLVSLGNETIIENIISRLIESGVSDIWISTGFQKEKVKEFLGDGSKYGANFRYIDEKAPLGTFGALSLINFPENETALVINGDIFSEVDYLALVRFHIRHNSDLTVAVHNISHVLQYGVVEVDRHQVISISEKPEFRFNINAGIYAVNSNLFRLMKTNEHVDATDFIRQVLERKTYTVTAFLITERWIDIGQPKQLQLAKQFIKDKYKS